MDSSLPLSKHSKSTAVVVFISVVLQSVGAGTTEYTAIYTFLFYVLFIHPHISPFMVLGQLQASIYETTVLFDEHNTSLFTVERTLRELRAETYMLTAGHLDSYRRVSITDICSWMVYASKVKDTWKKAREYRKRITDLKTKMEVKLLEDAEVNEQAALRQIRDTYLEQKTDIQHFEDISEKERLSSLGRERREENMPRRAMPVTDEVEGRTHLDPQLTQQSRGYRSTSLFPAFTTYDVRPDAPGRLPFHCRPSMILAERTSLERYKFKLTGGLLIAMQPHSAAAYRSVIRHFINMNLMAVALNEKKNMSTVEGVEERLLDARNIQAFVLVLRQCYHIPANRVARRRAKPIPEHISGDVDEALDEKSRGWRMVICAIVNILNDQARDAPNSMDPRSLNLKSWTSASGSWVGGGKGLLYATSVLEHLVKIPIPDYAKR
ncbi:hypothetical protein EDD85DRAFT_1004043 [Armillaria nabsnona]|nr:hypothetical protein EDD85DRAFT_1004043 [Armillaria nabsnona]